MLPAAGVFLKRATPPCSELKDQATPHSNSSMHEDRLEAPVAALFRGTPRFALDQEQLTAVRIAFPSSRPACRVVRHRRARLCGASGRGPCGQLAGRAASIALLMILRATVVFCSRRRQRSLMKACTMPAMSEFSLPLVCLQTAAAATLHADYRHQPFADVVAGQFSFTSLNRPICWPRS